MIYFITDEGEEYIKIGYTNNEKITNRLGTLQTGCPLKLKIFARIEGGIHLENKLHMMFVKYQTVGEWFIFNDEIKGLILDLKSDNLSSVAIFYRELYLEMLHGEDTNILKAVKSKTLKKANKQRKGKRESRQNDLVELVKVDPDLGPTELTKRLNEMGHSTSISTIKRDIKALNGKVKEQG